MTYARFFYPRYFKDIRGIGIHIDADVIVQGKLYLYNYKCDTFKLNMGLEEKSCCIGLSFVFMIS